MNILVFDKITRKYKGSISKIASLIWTERYWECGDFELETLLIPRIILLVEEDDYFKIAYSKSTMVVESVEITSPTSSSGGKIKIKGRSLESILDRRILWADYQRSAPAKTYIPELIEACFKDADNGEERVVEYLTVKDASDIVNEDDDIIEVDASRGDGLYSIIASSALASEIGFTIDFDNNTGLMTFYLYEGEDRRNLIFSERNLILQNANLYRSKENYKNIALVAGEGEGKKRKMVTVTQGDEEPTALQRRELWVDARDVQKLDGENNKKYNNRLTLRGVEKLEEHIETITAEGKLINFGRYKIREDFDLGDIITIQNQFFTATARITEIIQSWDSADGYTIYPGFITKDVTYRSRDVSEESEYVGDVSSPYSNFLFYMNVQDGSIIHITNSGSELTTFSIAKYFRQNIFTATITISDSTGQIKEIKTNDGSLEYIIEGISFKKYIEIKIKMEPEEGNKLTNDAVGLCFIFDKSNNFSIQQIYKPWAGSSVFYPFDLHNVSYTQYCNKYPKNLIITYNSPFSVGSNDNRLSNYLFFLPYSFNEFSNDISYKFILSSCPKIKNGSNIYFAPYIRFAYYKRGIRDEDLLLWKWNYNDNDSPNLSLPYIYDETSVKEHGLADDNYSLLHFDMINFNMLNEKQISEFNNVIYTFEFT